MPKKIDLSLLDGGTSYETEADSFPSVIVPNQMPKITSVPYKVAIIGEAPGRDEVEQGKPFVGWSGKELDRFLSRFGILRDACYIGNVCRHRPPGNKIAAFDWNGPEIQQGIETLRNELTTFDPNIVLLLGGTPLHVAMVGALDGPGKRKGKDGYTFSFPNSISNWRGSFFLSSVLVPGKQVKCIPSFHPAACLRNYEWTPLLMMDIQRCMSEATTKDLVLPRRELKINLSVNQLIAEMELLSKATDSFGCDIEGDWNVLKCVTFSLDPSIAFAVPFVRHNGNPVWSLDEEVQLWKALIGVLSNPFCVKTWQNGLYDRFVFMRFNLVVRGRNKDILLKHWELYCELKKNLAVQASLYTKEPYYKEERESEDWETFLEYGCKDSAVTKEIDTQLDRFLSPSSKKHYEFNETLVNSLLYMEVRGICFNRTEALKRKKLLENHMFTLQRRLNVLTGFGVRTTDKTMLRCLLRDSMCHKRNPSEVKKGSFDSLEDAVKEFDLNMRILLGEGDLTESQLGRLDTMMNLELNVEGKVFKKFVYETLVLPVQHHPDTGEVTTNYQSLQTLLRLCKEDHKLVKNSNKVEAIKCLPICIEIGECRTRLEHLTSLIKCSNDFKDTRVHSFYNEVGTETGRVTCGKLFKTYGYPLQTVEDENDLKPLGHPLRLGLRDLLSADQGCLLGKCDLKGADGWTIGANLAALGHPTMLDDLNFGLKPAHFPCYEFRHGKGSTRGKTREELKEMFKEIKKEDWDYFASKQCTWGFFYLLGLAKSADHIFNVSEGTVSMTKDQMQVFKDVLFTRYYGTEWHRAAENRIRKQPYPPKFVSSSGHVRMFFGRRSEILGEWLAHEPQSVTTFATNSAVYKCWTDPENRRKEGWRTKLIVEPLHQVHDEFLCQFKEEDLEFAKRKIREWFNTKITVAGIDLVIPFSGTYGTNWSMNADALKGEI